MANQSRKTLIWIGAAFALGAAGASLVGPGRSVFGPKGSSGVEPRSGFAFLEADRRKSRAYLSFMYGVLHQERGQRREAAERFAEASVLDRVLQPSFESDHNPS